MQKKSEIFLLFFTLIWTNVYAGALDVRLFFHRLARAAIRFLRQLAAFFSERAAPPNRPRITAAEFFFMPISNRLLFLWQLFFCSPALEKGRWKNAAARHRPVEHWRIEMFEFRAKAALVSGDISMPGCEGGASGHGANPKDATAGAAL